jgi:hypothetical protein
MPLWDVRKEQWVLESLVKKVVGWKIWCKLLGMKTKILSPAWKILQMVFNVTQKCDFTKMIVFIWAIQSRLKTNSERKVLRVKMSFHDPIVLELS